MNKTDDFVKSISSDDIPSIITHCFDELMVLYHMVGNRQDIEICADGKMPISFMILMESEDDAIKLIDAMNGLDFSVYGTPYIVEMSRSAASIHTSIRAAC